MATADGLTGKPIDVHTHAFSDELAQRAMEKLLSGMPECKAFSDGTRTGLLAQMDKAGVGRAVVASIATKAAQMAPIFAFGRLLKENPRFIPFVSVFPGAPDAAQWVERAAQEFAGVKCHPHYQGVQLDDPAFVAFVKAARDTGLVLLMHAGYDPAFPGDRRAAPEMLARLLDAVDGVKMIAAHLGGWLEWENSLNCLAGREGLYLDTSSSLERMPRELAVALIEKHGAGQVVFGSDSPWEDMREERARVEALGLPDDSTQRILWRNAARLLGL